MEVNKCNNCGLVNLEGDTRCQRCSDLLPEPGQTVSWTKIAPPPTHVWMADSTPPQPLAALTNPKLFPCPDCGHNCSRSAPSCPECGRPFSERAAPLQQAPPLMPNAPPAQPQIHYHYPYPYHYPYTRQVWSPGVAAVLSLFIPGVGQMYKGRILEGILWFLFTPIGYLFFIIPGLILHILCIVTATQGDPYKQGG